MKPFRTALARVAFPAFLFLSSCETNDIGPTDIVGAPPVVGMPVLAFDTVDIDMLVPSGNSYTISVGLAVQANDPDGAGDLAFVEASIFRPGKEEALSTIRLKDDGVNPVTGDKNFSGALSFEATRSRVGVYRVAVHARDRQNLRSNSVETPLLLTRSNTPPAVSLPTLRGTTPAGSDSTLFSITIAASDTDGYGDLHRVVVRAINAVDSLTVELFDNGLVSTGDLFPGDGVFSVRTWVRPAGELTDLVFRFFATDHPGASSDTLERTLTNSAPEMIALNVPDSIQRPVSGNSLIPFFATVADSDGLGDIDSVFFRNANATAPTDILMFDNGTNGDVLQGDGVYSRIVEISPTALLGQQQFHFTVVDRLGARDSRMRLITIY